MERNIRKFDILEPIQAFHLATVVLRLKAREEELKELFAKRGKKYREQLKNGDLNGWAMLETRRKNAEGSKSALRTSAPTGASTSLPAVPEEQDAA